MRPPHSVTVRSCRQLLAKYMGPLQLPENYPDDITAGPDKPLPFTAEHKARLATGPGMDAESVLIECLRGNPDLCDVAVPRDLVVRFGEMLNREQAK